MTNTTLNVPRELLERAVRIPTKASVEENHAAIVDRGRAQSELRALLSAPSPAGVDGLEVVGWYRMDDRKAITPYPSVCATWHKMGVKVGAAYSDSAHAIIDGLRGEIEVMTQHANNYSRMFEECAEERDQQARRIGELEAALEFACKALAQVTSSDGSGHADIAVSVLRMAGTKDADALHVVETYKAGAKWRIDAALSAGKEGE